MRGWGCTAFIGCDQLSHIIAPEHLQEQLTEEYPDKTVMTQAQYDDALVRKIQQHIPKEKKFSEQDKQKLAERVQHLPPATKASLMALNIPEDKTFSDLSKKALVQCFGDAPATLLTLLGLSLIHI